MLRLDPAELAMLRELRAATNQVIVALPEEIDMLNAAQVEEELILAIRQDATVIADMSATTFCDSAGARTVLQASKRATAAGGELRVITAAPVRRVFSILGIDQVIGTYSSLEAALARDTTAGSRAAFGPEAPATDSPQAGMA